MPESVNEGAEEFLLPAGEDCSREMGLTNAGQIKGWFIHGRV